MSLITDIRHYKARFEISDNLFVFVSDCATCVIHSIVTGRRCLQCEIPPVNSGVVLTSASVK